MHCHSVVSDGTKTPEELKQLYKAHGYSVIAYTDHDALIDHSDLTDDGFLALNGLEMEINPTQRCEYGPRCCHLCFIALEPDNLNQVCYHRTDYMFANAPKYRDRIKFDSSKPDFVREYTPECINKMISEGRSNGFFVTYNHPAWSLETLNEYGKYRGMNAMEICNFGCVEAGYTDYNEKEYDEILRGGERIFCIAADDNHNYRNDSFGGFTVINCEKLAYRSVTSALENGSFYASEAPEIKELWYENGKIGIECSAAVCIRLNTGTTRAEAVYGSVEDPLTSAVFNVNTDDKYVRITVIDLSGKHANTNAYFTDTL